MSMIGPNNASPGFEGRDGRDSNMDAERHCFKEEWSKKRGVQAVH